MKQSNPSIVKANCLVKEKLNQVSAREEACINKIVDAAYDLLSDGINSNDLAAPWVELFHAIGTAYGCYVSLIANGDKKTLDMLVKEFEKIVYDICKTNSVKVIEREKTKSRRTKNRR